MNIVFFLIALLLSGPLFPIAVIVVLCIIMPWFRYLTFFMIGITIIYAVLVFTLPRDKSQKLYDKTHKWIDKL